MAQDQVLGKAKHHKPGRGKPGIAATVTQGHWEVRRAIGFDNESCFLTEEIYDERSNGMLSSELGQHHLPAAQHLPKHPFCMGGVASQSTCLERSMPEQTGHPCLSAFGPSRLSP
jgi:hypothetical protein